VAHWRRSSVTARKRQEDLQSIPLSVSALSAAQIADGHVSKMDDLAFLVPNLNIHHARGQHPGCSTAGSWVVRGDPGGGLLRQRRAAVLKARRFARRSGSHRSLERPQGTLYGGNNIGGAIKYITKKPTADLQMQATAEFGNLHARNFSGPCQDPSPGRTSGALERIRFPPATVSFTTQLSTDTGSLHTRAAAGSRSNTRKRART